MGGRDRRSGRGWKEQDGESGGKALPPRRHIPRRPPSVPPLSIAPQAVSPAQPETEICVFAMTLSMISFTKPVLPPHACGAGGHAGWGGQAGRQAGNTKRSGTGSRQYQGGAARIPGPGTHHTRGAGRARTCLLAACRRVGLGGALLAVARRRGGVGDQLLLLGRHVLAKRVDRRVARGSHAVAHGVPCPALGQPTMLLERHLTPVLLPVLLLAQRRSALPRPLAQQSRLVGRQGEG